MNSAYGALGNIYFRWFDPKFAEAITLSAIVALTSGYENDDKVRIPKLAELARENNLEGLVDPVTGNYVSNEGDEDDEVPFEIAESKAVETTLLARTNNFPLAVKIEPEV